jgi:RNA-binding protein Musashi
VEFREFFSKFGTIKDSVIMADKFTSKPRGFGFVTFKDQESVNVIMRHKDRHCIRGKWIDCKLASIKKPDPKPS